MIIFRRYFRFCFVRFLALSLCRSSARNSLRETNFVFLHLHFVCLSLEKCLRNPIFFLWMRAHELCSGIVYAMRITHILRKWVHKLKCFSDYVFRTRWYAHYSRKNEREILRRKFSGKKAMNVPTKKKQSSFHAYVGPSLKVFTPSEIINGWLFWSKHWCSLPATKVTWTFTAINYALCTHPIMKHVTN